MRSYIEAMKRLCLFAGYSPSNQVENYVVHYLRELSKISDVYYLAANEAPESELAKLDGIARWSGAEAHDKYDFGSWQKLIFRLGWQEVEKYDAIILANDSNYGPLHDLGGVFERMDAAGLDAWGITENYGVARHLQSYFLTVYRSVIDSVAFRNFFESIAAERSKVDVCLKYEIGLGKLLSENHFSFASFIDRSAFDVPFHADVSSYQNTLIRHGSPFLKRKVVTESGFASEDVEETRTLLRQLEYPLDWISTRSTSTLESGARSAADTLSKEEAPLEALTPLEAEMPIELAAASVPAPRSSWMRAYVKRILQPLYRPIKVRFVENLFRIDHNVAHLVVKTESLEDEVSKLRVRAETPSAQISSIATSVDHLLGVVADMQGRLSGVSRSSREAASGISDIQQRMSGLTQHLRDGEVRLMDLQTSAAELHGHLDWAQRDILIGLMSKIDLTASKGFKCVTDYPIAYDSPDHIHPVGTVLDHTRHPRFIRACEDYFGASRPLSFLDLGCSAGGIVLDAILRGHVGVGLEGSDISRLQQRAEWRLLGDSLFTCDITRPFELSRQDESPFKFDVISAWEVLEHLTPEGVDGMFANLSRHTRSGSVFACSISQVDGGFTDDGVPLHQTLEPLSWWTERAAKHGFHILESDAFKRLDFARGNGNPSIYYRPEHSYRESESDCLLVTFERR